MAKVRAILYVFFGLFVAIAIGIVLFLKVYLPRPEAAARFSQLLSRSFGAEVHVGRIQVPSGWTVLGPIVLHDVIISWPGIDGRVERIEVPLDFKRLGSAALDGLILFDRSTPIPLFRAQSVTLRPRLLPLFKRELKFRWIEVKGPVLRFEGPPFKECDVALAYLNRALEGWADLEREAHRVPVDRLQLQEGVLAMARFRFTDMELHAEGWGRPLNHFQLRGKFTGLQTPNAKLQTPAIPFHVEAQVFADPFRLAARIRFEETPLAPLQPLAPTLDLRASQATALLTLVASKGKQAEGFFEARAKGILSRESKEPWDPMLRARFRLDLVKGEASVSEATLTAPGIRAKGRGKVGCVEKRLNYAVEMKDLVTNLAELRGRVPGLPGEAGGRLVVQAFEAKGAWPGRPPNLKIVGFFEGMGPFSFRSARLLALNGQWQVEGDLDRLKAQVNLKGTGCWMSNGRCRTLNFQHPIPSIQNPVKIALTSLIQGSARKGDFTLEPLKVEIDPLGKARLTGKLRGWGRASVELETGPIQLDLATLHQLIAPFQADLKVEAVKHLSLRFTGGPKALPYEWETWAELRALSLKLPGHSATLRGMKAKLSGRGTKDIEGTILGTALSVDKHLLEPLTLAFGFHDGRLSFKDLKASAYGGEVEGEGAFVPSTSEGELRFRIRHLRLGKLLTQFKINQGFQLPSLSHSSTSSLTMSGEGSLKISRRGLSFQLKTEPVPATEVAAFTLGKASVLPVALSSEEVWGEVIGSWGLGTGGWGVELSGTLSLQKGGILSLRIPFEYRDGMFRFWGDQVPLGVGSGWWVVGKPVTTDSLPPTPSHLPIRARGGEVVLSWQGQLSSQGFRLAGQALLQKLELDWGREGTPPWSLPPLSGTVPFTLEDGLFKVPEIPLTVGDHAQIFLAATLSLARSQTPWVLKSYLPPTKTSSLQKAIPGLLPRMLLDAPLQGVLEARVEVFGDRVQGEVRIQDGGINDGIATIEGVSGRIPLMGRWGASPKRRGEEWSEAIPQTPASGSPFLTISSVSYAGLTLRDLAVHFSTQNGPLAIDHLSFQGLGGRGRGRGFLDLFGGSLHLQLFVEGLSLREICDQFPPIKGYISGKVNGMLELDLPLFEPSQSKGRARFWAVKSKEEPRKISKALIERLGGQSGGFFNLFMIRGDRRYNHGLLEVTLQDRSLTFHRLEISNTLLFFKDLDIKVIPPYNTIAIQDLFDTIQETWERVQG